MPVLTEDGLVGKTTVVRGNASTILLISDENCKVACSVEGTREQGIVRGSAHFHRDLARPGAEFPLEAGRPQARPESLLLRGRRRLPLRRAHVGWCGNSRCSRWRATRPSFPPWT